MSSSKKALFIDRPGTGTDEGSWCGSSIVVRVRKLSAGKLTRGHLRARLEG